MSERSGIPVSTLSKVENDRLTLTYDKLLQLSERLHVPIGELFAEAEPAEEGVTARRSIGRLEDAIRVTTPNYDYYYLCTELRRKRMVPILTRIRAKFDTPGLFVWHCHIVEHEDNEMMRPYAVGPIPQPQAMAAATQPSTPIEDELVEEVEDAYKVYLPYTNK